MSDDPMSDSPTTSPHIDNNSPSAETSSVSVTTSTAEPQNYIEHALYRFQQQNRNYQQQYPQAYHNHHYMSLTTQSPNVNYGATASISDPPRTRSPQRRSSWSEKNPQYQHSLTSLPPAVPFPDEESEDGDEDGALTSRLSMASSLSWIVNIILLVVKLIAAVATGSQSILASLADSAVDLISQGVLTVAEGTMTVADEEYPVGKNRLEALAVITCAAIMSMASAFVIQSALHALYLALRPVNPIHPVLDIQPSMMYVLIGGTVAKFVLWIICRNFSSQSDSMNALAEDHLNDVMSNSAAIAAAVVTARNRDYWWLDGAMAVIVSTWIIYRWFNLTKDQMDKLVGKAAPASFVTKCHTLADRHHPMMRVDVIRAYHMGSRYAVELEVVMPPEMPLRETHDIALALQHHIESMQKVERAFVHVDYAFRDTPEHKVERKLGSTGGHINTKQ